MKSIFSLAEGHTVFKAKQRKRPVLELTADRNYPRKR